MSEGINRAEGMLLLLSVVLEVFSFHFQYRRVQTSIYSFLSIRKKMQVKLLHAQVIVPLSGALFHEPQ